MFYHLRYIDLRLLNFSSKDRFFVELREINEIENRFWRPLFMKAKAGSMIFFVVVIEI
jgi:hypothetical protein